MQINSESGMMRKRDIIFAGMATGAFVGLLMMVITHIPLGSTSDGSKITIMYHWSGALLTLIGIPLMSAFSVKYGSRKLNCCEPSMKQLIPVAYLTFLLPVLGTSFGAPNSDLDTLATIVLVAAIGGAFWSLTVYLCAIVCNKIWSFLMQFPLFAHFFLPISFKKTDSSQTTTSPVAPSTTVIKNITIKDSVVMGDVSNDEE